MGRRYLQYSQQRKDHYVKYIKKTKGTHFDTLITEALCEVVTPKRRSQDEKEVRGGGAFQQRRGYVQRLGDGGRRPMWLESRGEKGKRGAGRGRRRPEQAGRCKGKPVKLSLNTPGCYAKHRGGSTLLVGRTWGLRNLIEDLI